MLWGLPLGVGLAGSVSEEEVFLCDFFWGILFWFIVFIFSLSLLGKNKPQQLKPYRVPDILTSISCVC